MDTIYYVTEISNQYGDEDVGLKTTDKEKAIEYARGTWDLWSRTGDAKRNSIEIRVYVEDVEDEDCTCWDYSTIDWRKE